MEGFNFKEGLERPKYHYTYTDNKILGHPIIFQCDANDDVVAQELFAKFVQDQGLDLSETEIVRGAVQN